MKTEERIEKQKEMVELLGTHFDKQGFQPTAGRVLGLLMIMDKEEYTFEEIVEELGISKSSASVALKNLELRDSIEYVTYAGDRKRHFRIKTLEPFALIDDFASKLTFFKKMQSSILDLKADKKSRNAIFFRDLSSMIDFFLENMDALKKEYENKFIDTK